MNNELATNGLPQISFQGLADTEQVGGSPDMVRKACIQLNELADEMSNFCSRLDEKKEDVLVGWDGKAAGEFQKKFPELLQAFSQVEPTIRSVAEWARNTMDSYVNADERTAEWIRR